MTDTLITNEQQLNAYIEHLRLKLAKNKRIKVSVKPAKQRTLTQNNCIYGYCRELSKAFNDAGYDMETILAKGTKIPWTENSVKKLIWDKVQIKATEKDSSTKLLTNEVSFVYDIVNRHLSETFGVFVLFPSRENYDY